MEIFAASLVASAFVVMLSFITMNIMYPMGRKKTQ